MLKLIEIKNKKEVPGLEKEFRRETLFDKKTESSVRRIIKNVREKGDKALKQYSIQFEMVDLENHDLKVNGKELSESFKKVDKAFIKSIEYAVKRITCFHQKHLPETWQEKDESGNVWGQLVNPIRRAGLYIPGGRASYPSTVLMSVIPAQVAGVKEIAVCVPPGSDGRINVYVAAVLSMLEVKEVYRIGGAQAIAAMAYGTETVKKVDKIAGPGNRYVSLAKKEVSGDVGIDMIAGPSEVLIIADETANPAFIAADMLAQAEHDPDAASILVTTSKKVYLAVAAEIKKQLEELQKKEIALSSIKEHGKAVITDSLDTAVDLSNLIAPEHLEIMTEKPEKILKSITNAGSIFLGNNTPEVAGDYVAGPNHTLPTGGTARFSSPLSAETFLKKSSLLSLSENGLKEMLPHIKRIAGLEGLDAHAKAAMKREDR